MRDLSITTIQTTLFWEDPDKNLNHFSELIESIKTETDLIILPEMFTTGFSMNSTKLSEKMDGKSVKWLQKQAKQTKALIIGSLIIKEKGHFFNRLIAAHPSGEIQYYNKRHLFRMAKEDAHFSAGNKQTSITYKGWKIAPYICYDLRFPVWSRNTNQNDLYLYIANWPTARINAWSTLIKARAIENLSYVCGVNRIGIDGKGIAYNGQSAIIDYKGDTVESHLDNDSIITTLLSKKKLVDFRAKFPAHLDADNFIINE